jgi:hypothetical protein
MESCAAFWDLMYSAIHCFIPQIIDERWVIVRRILVGGFSERRGLPPTVLRKPSASTASNPQPEAYPPVEKAGADVRRL